MKSKTYAEAGVNIQAGASLKEIIGKLAETTFTEQVIALRDEVGLFNPSKFKRFKALYQLRGFKKAVLVASVDGVGTKLKIANVMGKYDTVGLDLVHHSVNDILIRGAIPLFFLDYVAMDELQPKVVEDMIKGLVIACTEVGCALIGGETAEMPGVYREGEPDLVGFIVGAVEKENVISGSEIAPGDAILCLPSSGLHTNGYSLVRKVFNVDEDPSVLSHFYPELGKTLGEELLIPHCCYLKQLKPLLLVIKGMAHITGGGIIGNLPRPLPQRLAAKIEKGSWQIPPIFFLIQKEGDIEEEEMYRVFNMGIGMAIICSPIHVEGLLKAIPGAITIGEVVEQKGKDRVIMV